jgi:glycosyltransferase involved in cell wall biosynthesis
MKKKTQSGNNLKVLLVSPSPPPVGGIQSWTVNILDFLKGQDAIRFCYIDSAVKYKDILEIGLWKRFSAGIRVTADLINALKTTIPKENPNVIHLTSSASLALFKDYLILKLAKRYNVPVVIHWRFGRIPDLAIKKNWEWKLISYIIQKSAFSIVIDEHSFEILKINGFKNIANIANPISKELEQIALRQIKSERKIEEGKVIFVGHVYVRKGVYELVEACASIKKVKKLKLIGPVKDEVSKELKNIAQVREDGEWLQLTGAKSREEVYEEICSAEFLVLPSYTEGFPNIVIEGMAMGCPILATNVGAIPEMLDICNSPAGFCISPQNIGALKESIEMMFVEKELRTEYGHNGLKRVLQNYNMHHIIEQYITVWQQVSNTTI